MGGASDDNPTEKVVSHTSRNGVTFFNVVNHLTLRSIFCQAFCL